jgi:acyl carrier protein
MVQPSGERVDLRAKIIVVFHEVLEARQQQLLCEISDDAILLETGLDSLGFAILVVQLEEELGYDPFAMLEEPVYPKTFGEFVDVYVQFYQKEHSS